MVEFRSLPNTPGYIEVSGMHDAEDLKPHLINYLTQQWRCKTYTKGFCDLKYACPAGFYHRQGLTNGLGRRTIQLAEFLSQHGWSLLLCKGGSVTPNAKLPNDIIREQQVKFTRAKSAEQAQAPLLMIELRTHPKPSGGLPRWDSLIEVCGRDTNNVY
eukprot:6095296-Amphidinium_carterae.1